ncbi:hypothetical protein [Chroococcus sp. FPU101]|uniref:hypothetical protein n=1 Tax=Chroococcus sp. FPU101 TaxID=1974212 RepID=UPI001A8DC0DD|nr:hypothetical protein [Chroococcus sp. FPU101]
MSKLTIALLTSLLAANSVSANNFKPQESPPPRKGAQGTRGCGIPIGSLFLYGIGNQTSTSALTQQLTLEINTSLPQILFQVVSEREESVKITINEIQGKFQRFLVFEQVIYPKNHEYTVVNLPQLHSNKSYLLTLNLLCQGRPQYGKTINTWLSWVNYPTQVNLFIQSQSRKLDENQY